MENQEKFWMQLVKDLNQLTSIYVKAQKIQAFWYIILIRFLMMEKSELWFQI